MVDDTTPDQELVQYWQAGQIREEIFEILARRYSPEIKRFFQRMGFAAVSCEDLAQETFLQAFRGLERFRKEASFRTWLLHIARNVARKRIRYAGTQKRAGDEVPLEELEDAGLDASRAAGREDPFRRLALEEDRRQVRAALGSLSADDRQLVLFRVWQDLSVRETAEILKKPEGTIKSGWSRIRGALGKKLGPRFSDLPS